MAIQKPAVPLDQRAAMSINEGAAYIGLGRSTLYEALREGRLRSLKVGARRLLRREDLIAFMESEAARAA